MEKGIAYDLLIHSVKVLNLHGQALWELDSEMPWSNATVLAILDSLYPGWVNEPMDNLFKKDWGDNPEDTTSTTAMDLATRTYVLITLVGKSAQPTSLSPLLATYYQGLFDISNAV